MQPFNHSQQLPFRYFDSDMARKRPLVVSFRRIQKMTPHNLDGCNSVSICDIHRLDTKIRDNNEVMTMKIMSKYGAANTRLEFAMQRKGVHNESQSCRNFASNDRQKSQLDSLFDDNDITAPDKGSVFPKEKFYGNSKLMLTMNDDNLRKAVIDCDDNDGRLGTTTKSISYRSNVPPNHLSKEDIKFRSRFLFKSDIDHNRHPTNSSDNRMIDEAAKYHKGIVTENNFSSRGEKYECKSYGAMMNARDKRRYESNTENETSMKAFGTSIGKSSSSPTSFGIARQKHKNDETEKSLKAPKKIQKSVSLLSINRN